LKLPKINLGGGEQKGKRRIWSLCLRLLICAAILWFIFYRIDFTKVLQQMRLVSPWAFILTFFIYVIANLLFALRWKKVLQSLQIDINLMNLFSLQLIGMFFNLFLPTSAGGDVIKAYYVSKDSGKKGASYLSVFLDRYIGLLSIILFAAIAAVAVKLTINGVVLYYWILLIFVIAVLFTVMLATNFAKWLNKLLGTRLKFVQDIISLVNESSQATLKHRRTMIWTFIYSLGFMLLVVWINNIFIISMGKSVALGDLLAFIAVISLAASFPISINGIGLREGAYIYLFATAGFSNEESLSLALLNFALLVLISLPGAVAYLLMGRGKTKLSQGSSTKEESQVG
jgi:glycosyltransferase 2 family protein